ncbi:MAG: hypothetical protein IPP42_06920 [Saprospiraceae bacterium]|nr:hypothetical protein [Saprospiraceae bacterium]
MHWRIHQGFELYLMFWHKAVILQSLKWFFSIGLQPSQYLSFLQNMWLPSRLNIFRLLAWSRGNTSAAKDLFESCGEPAFAAFYAAKANLFDDQRSINLEKLWQLMERQVAIRVATSHRNTYRRVISRKPNDSDRHHQDYPANVTAGVASPLTMYDRKQEV